MFLNETTEQTKVNRNRMICKAFVDQDVVTGKRAITLHLRAPDGDTWEQDLSVTQAHRLMLQLGTCVYRMNDKNRPIEVRGRC